MKKVGLLSFLLATLLFVGCGEKKEASQSAHSSSSIVSSVSSSATVRSVADCLPGTECNAPTTSTKAELPPPPPSLASGAKGARLFSKCASCHGPNGKRKALGKSAIIAGMAKDEVLEKLKAYQAGTLNQYGMGALMKGQLSGLKEADLEALANYISKLQ